MEQPEYKLGRLHAPDPRDLPMSLVPIRLPLTKRRHWTIGPVLDQGNTNSCVGHGWKQFLMTTPVRTVDGPEALDIYNQAKLIDEWPDNDTQDTGTSVRAGVQVLQQEGRIKSYLFAQSVDELVRWVLTRGPVVMGTVWHQQMFYPDPTSLVVPAGPIVGGHCYLLYGADTVLSEVSCVNSWGRAWGDSGKFKLKLDALDYLLREQGEACVAVEHKLPAGA